MFRTPRQPPGGPEEPAGPDRQRILLDALADLSSTLDLDEVLDRILARSLELSGAERALLLLVGEEGRLAARRARRADGRPLEPDGVAFSSTVVRRALREGRAVTQELSSDSQALALSESVFQLRLRSVLCAPMTWRGRVLGAIYVDSRVQRKTFQAADREVAEALARQAAIALQNARLLREAEERARLGRELELAAEIQQDLLPDAPPAVPGLDVAGRAEPCEEISGDFYDFLPLEGERLGFLVADVTGHGVGPALLAAEARGEIHALLPLRPDPGWVLSRVHASLRTFMDPGRFLTLLLVVVEPAGGRLLWASAGHPEGLLLRAGGGRELLGRTGPPLGVDVDAIHTSRALAGLGPGDRLLACTDGVLEARDASGEVLGAPRLEAALRRLDGSAAGQAEALLQQVAAFTGGRRDDDRTLVVLRWT